jgi:hypothetical protein
MLAKDVNTNEQILTRGYYLDLLHGEIELSASGVQCCRKEGRLSQRQELHAQLNGALGIQRNL